MRKIPSILRYEVFACPQGAPPLLSPDYGVLEVTEANVDRVLDFRGEAQRVAFKHFLREGCDGIYAIHHGVVVGHAWLTTARGEPLLANGYFPLRPGDALIHHCHVAKSARGQGIFPLLIRHLSAQGSGRVFIDASVRNHASLSGIRRAGCRPVGRLTALAWRGHALVWPKHLLNTTDSQGA